MLEQLAYTKLIITIIRKIKDVDVRIPVWLTQKATFWKEISSIYSWIGFSYIASFFQWL